MRFATCALLMTLAGTAAAQPAGPAVPPHLPPLDRALPPRAEAIYRAVASRVDRQLAYDLTSRIAPLWRLAGNPAFDQSLDWIDQRLKAAGLTTHGDVIPSTSQGWEMRDAELRLDGPGGEIVLSKAQDRVPLAINSHPTAATGVTATLVDVGPGTAADHYDGKAIAGAVVLADGPIGAVWNQAVKVRGAVGVISTQLAGYTRPDETPDVLQWGAIPYTADITSFGFKATPRAARRLRERLAAGMVRVHVRADTVFHRRPVRTLVAEIPGTRWPDERVVLVRLNRPQALNALNSESLGALMSILQPLDADPGVGCVVLTGSDRAFAAGDDKRRRDDTESRVQHPQGQRMMVVEHHAEGGAGGVARAPREAEEADVAPAHVIRSETRRVGLLA